jgi:hypothetical protein
MSEPLVVVPEAVVGSWHDAASEIASGALEQLRLGESDGDAPRIGRHALEACAMIDEALELRPTTLRVYYTVGGRNVIAYATGDAPAQVIGAAISLTVDLYARKDATLGVLGTGPDAVRLSGDHLAGVRSVLAPFVEGFAIA